MRPHCPHPFTYTAPLLCSLVLLPHTNSLIGVRTSEYKEEEEGDPEAASSLSPDRPATIFRTATPPPEIPWWDKEEADPDLIQRCGLQYNDSRCSFRLTDTVINFRSPSRAISEATSAHWKSRYGASSPALHTPGCVEGEPADQQAYYDLSGG